MMKIEFSNITKTLIIMTIGSFMFIFGVGTIVKYSEEQELKNNIPMKANAIFVRNLDEIHKGEDIGVEVSPDIQIDEFYFDINAVIYCYRNDEGNINVNLDGEIWSFQWDEDLYRELRQYLGR